MRSITTRRLCSKSLSSHTTPPAAVSPSNCCGSGRIPSSHIASLPHPTQMETIPFHSPVWRHAMCQLYRVILQLHAVQLHPLQREFGDRFVQVEFQRHVEATERHARIFYQSWYKYVVQLSAGETSREMTEEERRQLTPEQKERLRELRSHVVRARQTDSDFML